jgi:putative hydrolase of the HAD superfamily
MRKPDEEIYEHVIRENQLIPSQTLFLDDYGINLEGARKTGLQTFHVQHPQSVLELFA